MKQEVCKSRFHAVARATLLALCTTLFVQTVPGFSTANAQAEREVIVDRIVARVNDELITQSQIARLLPIYIQVMGPSNPQDLQTTQGREQVARDLIQFLVDVELLEDKADEVGMQMTSADVDAYLANYQSQLDMTPDQFQGALEREGIDYDDYHEFMRKYLIQLQMMRAEGLTDIAISDAEVQQVFEVEYPEGLEETYIRTSHIFVELDANDSDEQFEIARGRLVEARRSIMAGERTFEEVATEINEDSTADRGGQLAAFPVADLDESYSRAALSVEEGELCEPVITPRGMHVIRLDEIEHRQSGDEERIRERIRYGLRQSKTEQRKVAYLVRLRRSAFIEVLVDDFSL